MRRFGNTDLIKNIFDQRFILIVFGGLYLTIVCCNQYFYRTFCFDYGVYNFAFHDYAHFRITDCPLYIIEHMNFLQDHLSFTFFLFIPLYWLFGWLTGAYTLLLIQTAFILIGGVFVHKLIVLKTSDKVLSVLALIQYLILYGRWTMFGADCNLAIIASSMIPVFIYYFERKNLGLMYLMLLFILVTREDMALWLLFIGLFLLIRYFKDRQYRSSSLLVIIISISYFALCFAILIPSLETEYKQYSLFNYSALGKNPWEALVFIFSNPIETSKLFFINTSGNPIYNNVKFEFYYLYFICGGFLLFYRPVYLLLFIPILAKKMLNDEPLRWSVESYYSVEFVSILPIAVFLIVAEIKGKWIKMALIVIVSIGSVSTTVYKLLEHKDRSVFWFDNKYAFYKKSFYKSDYNVRKVNQQIKLIPSHAAVSASGTIVPHLAWRPEIYNFPKVKDAGYIVVFTDRDTYPLNQDQFDSTLNTYLNQDKWQIFSDDFPLLILKREERTAKKSRVKEAKILEYRCDAESISADGSTFTSSSAILFKNADLQSHEEAYEGKYSIRLTKDSPYGMTTTIERVTAGERFEISVWRLAGQDYGKIVASSIRDNIFYHAESQVVHRNENGWELVKMKIIIPRKIPKDELKIYLWNNGEHIVYFDDLRILRKLYNRNSEPKDIK